MEGNLVRDPIWILLISVCLAASVVAAGQAAAHDLKITTRHRYPGSEYTTTTYYSGENSRSETQRCWSLWKHLWIRRYLMFHRTSKKLRRLSTPRSGGRGADAFWERLKAEKGTSSTDAAAGWHSRQSYFAVVVHPYSLAALSCSAIWASSSARSRVISPSCIMPVSAMARASRADCVVCQPISSQLISGVLG